MHQDIHDFVKTINLSANTVKRRINEMADDVENL